MNRSRIATMMAISLSFVVCCVLLIPSLLVAEPEQQHPIIIHGSGSEVKDLDLIHELKKAEIIPTVIDVFRPLLTVSVSWKNTTAKYGNTINPALTQHTPQLHFVDKLPSTLSSQQLTLAMTDPDAPSRDNPEWSEICHWIATGIPLTTPDDDSVYDLEEVMEYKPPGPPPKTGKHRYVFVALAPINGSTERLHLKKPDDRQHWGYENERQGLRKWADENGLGVVGANFIYEQNDEQ